MAYNKFLRFLSSTICGVGIKMLRTINFLDSNIVGTILSLGIQQWGKSEINLGPLW